MSATKIEWAHETWNPISGCSPVSAGCKNCYAARMAKRLAGRHGYPKKNPFALTWHEDQFYKAEKWMNSRKRKRIFVCSMGDLFHEDVPVDWRDRIFYAMTNTPLKDKHDFLILTKRPETALHYLTNRNWISVYWKKKGHRPGESKLTPNVWIGVTAEDQAMADERIPVLLQIPAAVRFVSVEPMLGHISLEKYIGYYEKYNFDKEPESKLDWVICGAETGPGKRPMERDWARALRDQCVNAGVPFFFKKDSNGVRSLDGMWEQFPGGAR